MRVKVITWLWRQDPPRLGLDVEKVNTWAARMRERLPRDVGLAVVTDLAGVDRSRAEVIRPPGAFVDVRSKLWPERTGAPQCYRRLDLFRPDAAEIFGADWLVSLDLDVVIGTGSDALEHFTTVDDATPPLTLHRATCSRAHYNGGLVRLRAGARVDVHERFAADPAGIAAAASRRFAGSDQAVLSQLLGPGAVPTFGEQDGVYSYSTAFIRADRTRTARPPANLRLLFFPGNVKPWSREAQMQPWIPDRWYGRDLVSSSRAAGGSPRQGQR